MGTEWAPVVGQMESLVNQVNYGCPPTTVDDIESTEHTVSMILEIRYHLLMRSKRCQQTE